MLALDGMDLDGTFGVDLSQTKAEMIDDRECGMTHCMAFQGVELGEDGKPRGLARREQLGRRLRL